VTFDRSVADCAFNGTSANVSAFPGPTIGVAVASHVEGDPKQVRVVMVNPASGNATDMSFHLVVYCHK
jgi:hypothetical protein